MNYTEIKKLNHKLNEMGIEHEFRPKFDGYQIILRKPNINVSIIQHCGSYGCTKDLVEGVFDEIAKHKIEREDK